MDKFIYAIGRLRAREAQLLDGASLQRMIEAKSFNEAFTLLRENPYYSAKIDRLPQAFDLSALLEQEEQDVIALLKELAPGNQALQLLWQRFAPEMTLDDYLQHVNFRPWADSHLLVPYLRSFVILARLRNMAINGHIEVESTKLRYRYTNYRWAVELGLDHYQKSGSLIVLEREIDNHLLDQVRPAKYLASGLDPLIGYWVAKEIEIKNLRLILIGKKLQLPNHELQLRLRKSYV
ncbi:hypothetical protein A2311_02035 [candidate division WOR-1 bacterium RIFOXYB2_FULL_48_7]|uniref:V-type ATP synthase subunit C n=1 Tax=candidate division WOR-1 bacterium RIFOXYB2_FULL_48_7 TaxID=1802583 RepID=A0A1F4TVP6_UNCSA|nr:MAG: hypothetical protein A2311_02035 [candidate division WOR-1 bacterium RIFOXYB2_FULL_48_7]